MSREERGPPRAGIAHDRVSNEHLMQLKSMTADTIAYFLHDHPETRVIVDLILEEEDELSH